MVGVMEREAGRFTDAETAVARFGSRHDEVSIDCDPILLVLRPAPLRSELGDYQLTRSRGCTVLTSSLLRAI